MSDITAASAGFANPASRVCEVRGVAPSSASGANSKSSTRPTTTPSEMISMESRSLA